MITDVEEVKSVKEKVNGAATAAKAVATTEAGAADVVVTQQAPGPGPTEDLGLPEVLSDSDVADLAKKQDTVAEHVVTTITSSGEQKSSGLMQSPASIEQGVLMGFIERSRELDKRQKLITIAHNYFEFDSIGDSVRGVFMGFHMIYKNQADGTKEPVLCVVWMTNGETFMNGSVALRSDVQRANIEVGTELEIKFKGKKEKVNLFDVYFLG